jgi:two-component system phosphate regulon sensor histidine kinase PhoR
MNLFQRGSMGANASRRTLEFLHAQAPFMGALGVLTIFFASAHPTPRDQAWWIAGSALAVGVTALSLVFPWRKVRRSWMAVIPLLDIVAVSLLREGTFENEISVTILLGFPVLWLAYAFTTNVLVVVAGAMVFVTLLPFFISRELPTTSDELIALLVTPLVVLFLAIAVNLAARRMRSFQTRLRATTQELQASLARAEEREIALQAVLDTVQAGIAVISPEGQVLVSNEMAQHLVDMSGASRIGKAQAAPLVFRSDRMTPVPDDEQLAARALRGDHLTNELFWVGPPSDQAAIVVSSQMVKKASGDPYGTVIAVHDVTPLMESIKVREDFLASVSHEMKTPLTSIIGYLEVLEDGIDVDAPGMTTALSIVQRNVDRLFAVIADLLTAGRTDSPLQRSPTDMVRLAQASLDTAAPTAAAAGVTLAPLHRTGGSADGVPIDPIKVGRILDNLLSNAIKYSKSGGAVRLDIHLDAAENELALAIADDGVGISPGDQRQLFERFFRAESARVNAIPGVGLGLSIVRELVDVHQGSIDVQSALGDGTTVTVRLPLHV